MFFKRTGTTDEYPLTEEEVAQFARPFGGKVTRYYPRFQFFYLAYFIGWHNPVFRKLMWDLDTAVGRLFPLVRPYSCLQELLLRKGPS